jgi:hypothetical protein
MQNFEDAARQLLNPRPGPGGANNTDMRTVRETQLRLATDIKELIELVHTSRYTAFLRSFFGVFQQLLISGIPPQVSSLQ